MPKVEYVDIDAAEAEGILERIKAAVSEEDYLFVERLVRTYLLIIAVLQSKKASIKKLQRMMFGSKTEKTRNVLKDDKQDDGKQDDRDAQAEASDEPQENEKEAEHKDKGEQKKQEEEEEEKKKKRKGHGRNGAAAFTGAPRVPVDHPSLKPGDDCPECGLGRVYKQAEPRKIIRFVGQAPIHATVYELQRLRCNLCGTVFTAPPPEGVGDKQRQYDETASSMMGYLRYWGGMPLNRLEALQAAMGIPLPASTQWDVTSAKVPRLEPAYHHLIWLAAQEQVFFNDDTTAKILELMGPQARQQILDDTLKDRTGLFTSGIVATGLIGGEGHRIALFFTGMQHAGENLADVLKKRAAELGPPIQMCDALSRNIPKDFDVLLANCLAHGRREVVDVIESFPEECRYVLRVLRQIYRADAFARKHKVDPQRRLEIHQRLSEPRMAKLKKWLDEQFTEKRVEPNSALGKAFTYLLNHWEPLTLFLRQPGAPLDNNICERILKAAIRHRKNSLFYKTCNGAYVGDVYMSLIYTCHLCGADPFDYLTEVQRHHEEVADNPQAWMPWNYPTARQRVA